MSDQSRHDAWAEGENYDAYMGRWSRQIAPGFLDWFDAPPGLDWLEVGCGTGALSGAILAQAAPSSLQALDPSAGFVARARETHADARADFTVGDARALALPDASRDAIVSGLVLNFVPDRPGALAEMARVARPEGRIGFYVWDYPGGGVEFMRAFWTAAAALDPEARTLSEDVRFPFAERSLVRAGIDDTRHDRNGAAHPQLIEPGPVHVVRIVRLSIQAQAFPRRAECPTGVSVQQLQDPALAVQAVIQNRSGPAGGAVDDILLGVLVQFVCEDCRRCSHE